jgi:hypothetical protein|tara:strand:+ start:2346 stop:2594 length:249 start_codon:yes stop_codon:yes gene_type:complete
MNKNYLIPSFIRKGDLKMDIEKVINNLENEIKRYNNGDEEITLLSHEMNCKTLQHFKRVKKDKEVEQCKENVMNTTRIIKCS